MNNYNSLFVWNALRISFWLMVIINVLTYFAGDSTFIILMLVLASIFSFVFSIIHLVKYKEKALAIVSLCISGFYVFIFVIGISLALIGVEF